MTSRLAPSPIRFAEMLQQQSVHTERRLEQAKAAREFLEDISREYEQQLIFFTERLDQIAAGKSPDWQVQVEFDIDSTPEINTEDRFANSTIANAVATVLEENSGPLHIRDIVRLLRVGGWTTEAQRPDASVVSVLIRDENFVKLGRNIFSLSQGKFDVNEPVQPVGIQDA